MSIFATDLTIFSILEFCPLDELYAVGSLNRRCRKVSLNSRVRDMFRFRLTDHMYSTIRDKGAEFSRALEEELSIKERYCNNWENCSEGIYDLRYYTDSRTWETAVQNIREDLEDMRDFDWHGTVVAGGFVCHHVMSTLTGKPSSYTDVDIFFTQSFGERVDELKRIFPQVESETPYLLNLRDNSLDLKVQLIKQERKSFPEILLNFDLDMSKALYDGETIWVTKRFLLLQNTELSVYKNLSSMFLNYRERLMKYASNKQIDFVRLFESPSMFYKLQHFPEYHTTTQPVSRQFLATDIDLTYIASHVLDPYSVLRIEDIVMVGDRYDLLYLMVRGCRKEKIGIDALRLLMKIVSKFEEDLTDIIEYYFDEEKSFSSKLENYRVCILSESTGNNTSCIVRRLISESESTKLETISSTIIFSPIVHTELIEDIMSSKTLTKSFVDDFNLFSSFGVQTKHFLKTKHILPFCSESSVNHVNIIEFQKEMYTGGLDDIDDLQMLECLSNTQHHQSIVRDLGVMKNGEMRKFVRIFLGMDDPWTDTFIPCLQYIVELVNATDNDCLKSIVPVGSSLDFWRTKIMIMCSETILKHKGLFQFSNKCFIVSDIIFRLKSYAHSDKLKRSVQYSSHLTLISTTIGKLVIDTGVLMI